jgi:hypothetical protein
MAARINTASAHFADLGSSACEYACPSAMTPLIAISPCPTASNSGGRSIPRKHRTSIASPPNAARAKRIAAIVIVHLLGMMEGNFGTATDQPGPSSIYNVAGMLTARLWGEWFQGRAMASMQVIGVTNRERDTRFQSATTDARE